MIDVIFLLLTFFIYNLLISTPVRVMPVQFADAATGNRQGIERPHVLRVDKKGNLFLGTEAIERNQLDTKLRDVASHPTQPTLFVFVEEDGETDRAPLLVNLIEQVKQAGIKNVTFVGRPGRGTSDEN